MSLIFDRFPSLERAQAFADAAHEWSGRDVWLFTTQAASDAADPFPFRLDPPIVHVDRCDDPDDEREIERMVRAYGGSFAGT